MNHSKSTETAEVGTDCKTLELVLTYQWFVLTLRGHKKREYRGLTEYWRKRLQNSDGTFVKFDRVRFRWSYQTDAPEVVLHWMGCTIDEKRKRFVIQLGPIISQANISAAIGDPEPEHFQALKELESEGVQRRTVKMREGL